MTGGVRVRLSGTVPVPLPPADAWELFTPEGERVWAEGWDPRYPAGATPEPGTVFVTSAGRATTWVLVACEPGREVAYARVAGAATAGIVRVRCTAAAGGTTVAEVTYDLTALTREAESELEAFAAGFDGYLEHWRQAIAHSSHPRRPAA